MVVRQAQKSYVCGDVVGGHGGYSGTVGKTLGCSVWLLGLLACFGPYRSKAVSRVV